MRAGGLRRKITFQAWSETVDPDTGEPIGTWANSLVCFADVQPFRGKEFIDSGRESTERLARFFIRYTDTIDEKDRILHDSKTYTIDYIREIGIRQGLEIVGRSYDA